MPYRDEEYRQAAEDSLRDGDIGDVERLIDANVVEVEELPVEDGPLKDRLDSANASQEARDKWLKARQLAHKHHLNEEETQLLLEVALDGDDRVCAEAALRNFQHLSFKTDLAQKTVRAALNLVIQNG